jgi:hypothetical protein
MKGSIEDAEWKKARVNLDCHIELGGHYYNTPYQLVRKRQSLPSSSVTGDAMRSTTYCITLSWP